MNSEALFNIRKTAPVEAEGGPASPELIEVVLGVCGRHYAAVTGTSSEQWDTELSRELLGTALRTVRLAERGNYPQALDSYLSENQVRLERLWRRYGPDGLYPRGVYHLVEMPECFVLCERIDRDRYWLAGVWGREQEETPLERLEEAWRFGTGEE